MIEQGYIKLHRSILKWEWYDDANTMRLFLHLLLTVNYEPKKWHGTTVERGQRVCSIATLSKETRLSQRSIRTCLERLISTGEVTKLSSPQYTVVTVKNYDRYQTPTNELTNERQTTDKPPTNDRQQCKKDKESNKKVKEIYPSDIELATLVVGLSDGMQKAITKWIAYKHERKSQYTPTGLSTLLDKLRKNAEEHGERAVISLIDTSISNMWQGIIWSKLEGENATPTRRNNTGSDSRTNAGTNSGEGTRKSLDFSKPRAGIPVPDVQG